MRAVIGIDPGLDGALALLSSTGALMSVVDMPSFRIKPKGNGSRVIDALGLARLIDAWVKVYPTAEAYLEDVNSHGMGLQSAFNFGEGYGIVKGVLAAHFIRVTLVTPARWKRAMRVTAAKDSSRAMASGLWPNRAAEFARVKDDGRAEAALIAFYGQRHLPGAVPSTVHGLSDAVLT